MQAHTQASSLFEPGVATHSVKLVMKRMQKHALQRPRPKLNVAVLAKMKMLGASMKKKVGDAAHTHMHGIACVARLQVKLWVKH